MKTKCAECARLRRLLKKALRVMDHHGDILNEVAPPTKGDFWTYGFYHEVRNEVRKSEAMRKAASA